MKIVMGVFISAFILSAAGCSHKNNNAPAPSVYHGDRDHYRQYNPNATHDYEEERRRRELERSGHGH